MAYEWLTYSAGGCYALLGLIMFVRLVRRLREQSYRNMTQQSRFGLIVFAVLLIYCLVRVVMLFIQASGGFSNNAMDVTANFLAAVPATVFLVLQTTLLYKWNLHVSDVTEVLHQDRFRIGGTLIASSIGLSAACVVIAIIGAFDLKSESMFTGIEWNILLQLFFGVAYTFNGLSFLGLGVYLRWLWTPTTPKAKRSSYKILGIAVVFGLCCALRGIIIMIYIHPRIQKASGKDVWEVENEAGKYAQSIIYIAEVLCLGFSLVFLTASGGENSNNSNTNNSNTAAAAAVEKNVAGSPSSPADGPTATLNSYRHRTSGRYPSSASGGSSLIKSLFRPSNNYHSRSGGDKGGVKDSGRAWVADDSEHGEADSGSGNNNSSRSASGSSAAATSAYYNSGREGGEKSQLSKGNHHQYQRGTEVTPDYYTSVDHPERGPSYSSRHHVKLPSRLQRSTAASATAKPTRNLDGSDDFCCVDIDESAGTLRANDVPTRFIVSSVDPRVLSDAAGVAAYSSRQASTLDQISKAEASNRGALNTNMQINALYQNNNNNNPSQSPAIAAMTGLGRGRGSAPSLSSSLVFGVVGGAGASYQLPPNQHNTSSHRYDAIRQTYLQQQHQQKQRSKKIAEHITVNTKNMSSSINNNNNVHFSTQGSSNNNNSSYFKAKKSNADENATDAGVLNYSDLSTSMNTIRGSLAKRD